ncbi:hypothetical protein ApDm4_2758 [Acetobacter pomorum]|nr:hypothetical protein ApDm4_2758 [Acetobacter pomorum]
MGKLPSTNLSTGFSRVLSPFSVDKICYKAREQMFRIGCFLGFLGIRYMTSAELA